MEKKVLSCGFNIDTACAEVKYADGIMIAIYCPRVEDQVADNMYERSELDWLVYNAPVDYVNLLLHGDIREYLKNVTEYRPFLNVDICNAFAPKKNCGTTTFFWIFGRVIRFLVKPPNCS